jgi:hypothetical protein
MAAVGFPAAPRSKSLFTLVTDRAWDPVDVAASARIGGFDRAIDKSNQAIGKSN